MGTVFEIGWNISHAETNVFFKIFCKCIKITQINLHSYFQKHDTDGTTCAPGGSDGNYIMYAHATSGNLPNNNKFSSCSINQMAPIIENKCRTTTGCFIGKRTCLKTNLICSKILFLNKKFKYRISSCNIDTVKIVMKRFHCLKY